MKEFIKSSLIEFAVIVLVLSLFDGIEINKWRNFIIFGWYEIDRIGYMVVVGVIVYGICYILGIAGNKKSADYINSQLEKRRKNRENIDKNSADR